MVRALQKPPPWRSPINLRFLELAELDSTNLEAVRRQKSGDAIPLWVRADVQTAGRGRRGRDWASPTGNFYGTACYAFDGTPAEAARVSFVAAIAVAEALSAYPLTAPPALKWPNDILIEGKKIAGLLLEFQDNHLIIGIGVNLTTHPAEARLPATHLLEYLSPEALNAAEPAFSGASGFLPILAASFDAWLKTYIQDGFAPIRAAWTACAAGLPGPVIVRLPQETFTGQATDLAEDGALRVRLPDGTMRDVHAGDVFFGD